MSLAFDGRSRFSRPEASMPGRLTRWGLVPSALAGASVTVSQPARTVHPHELVALKPLMELTEGRPEVVVGLVDGPVHLGHPDLSAARITETGEPGRSRCRQPASAACFHGTFIAGILVASRESPAPSICPGCTLVVSPIFAESAAGWMPGATEEELADAILSCVRAGARIINVSAAVLLSSPEGERDLKLALDQCARRGVIVVAAAGNQGTITSTTLTRHPAVLPVVACDTRGWPLQLTNLSAIMGRRGVMAPGERITSSSPAGTPVQVSGTSVAAPFVTGTLALLRSLFPTASAGALRRATTQATRGRAGLVPPMLDGAASLAALRAGRFEAMNTV